MSEEGTTDVIDNDLPGEQDDQQQQQQGDLQQTPKTGVDADTQFALKELATSVKTIADANKPKEKELTQDEKDKLWGVWNPESEDPEFFHKFLRLPQDMDKAEREQVLTQFKQLFGKMQTGLVKQAVTGAMNMSRAQHQEFYDKEFKPVSDFATETRREKTRESFYKAYPVLADEKYAKVVGAAANGLNGTEFKSNKEYFKALAESAAELIQGVLPDFTLETAGEETKVKPRTTLQLPRTRVGGTGGSGGGPQQQNGATAKPGGDIDELE